MMTSVGLGSFSVNFGKLCRTNLKFGGVTLASVVFNVLQHLIVTKLKKLSVLPCDENS